jgi:hypothetical protein
MSDTHDRALFERAMNYECKKCGQPAKFHRLTKSGNLYCLRYNFEHAYMGRYDLDRGYDRTYTVPVACLSKAPFSKTLGNLINANLHSFIEEAV